MELRDKTIVLTGGSSGIGFELARQLAAKGNRVTSFDVQVPPEGIRNVTPLLVDVAHWQEIERGMRQVKGDVCPCPRSQEGPLHLHPYEESTRHVRR